jgi:hypothetical protein
MVNIFRSRLEPESSRPGPVPALDAGGATGYMKLTTDLPNLHKRVAGW